MFRDYKNYDVLPDGRIWSKKSKKFLKPYTEKNGYQRVGLTDNNGKQHKEYVHRVTWIAINGEIPKGMQINHKKEFQKHQNAIWNLELVTPKQNINYGTRTERAAKARINHPEMSKRVAAYDKNGELVMVFDSTQEAGRQGFNQGNVWACCRNCFNREGNNKYKGYTWKYLDE